MNINLSLLGQMITFAIFVFVTMKYIWPPVIQALEERRKKIAEGLEAAERGRHELELAQHKIVTQFREAREEAAKIIEDAKARGASIVEESKHKAREEGQRLLEAAQLSIAQEVEQARQQLLSQVSGLVLSGTERILGQGVNAQQHQHLLDDLVKEL